MLSGSTLIVCPVLARPHRVEPLARAFAETTPEPYRLMFVGTVGDSAELDEVRRVAEADPAVVLEVLDPNPVGDYARKCNHAYRVSSEPFLFLGADDLAPRAGWLSAALELMADERIGVVGTQDLGNARVIAGDHATHSLVRRSYVDRFGSRAFGVNRRPIDKPGEILHEGYPHEFVDDEFVATARRRGAFAFCHASVVEHLHPLWGKAPTDPIYDAHAQRMAAGRAVFAKRRKLWR